MAPALRLCLSEAFLGLAPCYLVLATMDRYPGSLLAGIWESAIWELESVESAAFDQYQDLAGSQIP